MDQATSEQRRCEVCGDPIRRSNKYGICSDMGKSECRKARERLREKTQEPERKSCEICGDPIRSDNDLGICQRPDRPECRNARARKQREQGPLGKNRFCEVCGRRLRRDNSMGVCGGRGSPACAQERDRRRGWRRGTSAVPEGWTPPPYITAGAVFERLTVLEDVQGAHDPARCMCECGNEKLVTRAVDLVAKTTRSCNCLRRDLRTKHGLHSHPLYATWNGIIQRTTNPNDERYPNYGGRGIRISERWLDMRLFVEDIEREIGPRPEGVTEAGWPLYTLDRINVEGNYENGNVRWSSWAEQAMNRRKIPDITEQRDVLAAQVEALTVQIRALTEHSQMSRNRAAAVPAPSEITLF
jgi:hypothetical protein